MTVGNYIISCRIHPAWITSLDGYGWADINTNARVVRALSSQLCGPGSFPGLGVICGLSLVLVLVLGPRGFSPGTPVSPSKNQHF